MEGEDISDQTLRTGGDQAFRSDTGRTSQVRHLGETRLSGPTLGELLRSDSGSLGRQNLSGQTLGEFLRSDTRK